MTRIRFMSFLNKNEFDYTHGEVNPYEFHKTFYIFSKAFRVIGDEPIPKWTIFTPILVTFCGAIAAFHCLLSTIHFINIFDISLITESGTYFIVMVYKLVILSCTITDQAHFHNLMQAMKDDFKYICHQGTKYRLKYFQSQVWTFKASLLCSIFIAIIGGGMVICAVMALIITLWFRPKESIRPLPFPVWAFELDLSKTPAYEVYFMLSLLCIFTQTCTYIFMMQTQIVWIRQILSKADVIIWSMEDLLVDVQPANNEEEKEFYEGIIKARMRQIIKMHLSLYSLLENYAAVYKKLLMFEQKMVAPVVCLTSFCAAEKLDNGEIPIILLLLGSSGFILTFIPSYMCTKLAEKIQAIGDSCWTTPFWNAPGKVMRPYTVLIMQRSMQALPIQAPGFEDVSLETFSKKITFAYSCFNMLRQAKYEY